MVVAKPTSKWKMVSYGHGHVAKVFGPTTKANMGKTKMVNWSS